MIRINYSIWKWRQFSEFRWHELVLIRIRWTITSILKVALKVLGHVFFAIDEDESIAEVALEANSCAVHTDVFSVNVMILISTLIFTIRAGLVRIIIWLIGELIWCIRNGTHLLLGNLLRRWRRLWIVGRLSSWMCRLLAALIVVLSAIWLLKLISKLFTLNLFGSSIVWTGTLLFLLCNCRSCDDNAVRLGLRRLAIVRFDCSGVDFQWLLCCLVILFLRWDNFYPRRLGCVPSKLLCNSISGLNW